MHAALLRIQYARGMKVFPWCTCIILVACTDLCIKACFHPSESTVDPPHPPCSELWSLVWLIPQAMQRDWGETRQRQRRLSVSPECRDARWSPDWFSGPLPILYHSLSLLVSEVCSRGLVFLGLPPPQMSTCYLCAWDLIYERKSRTQAQFLTAETDNGGDWMKQFVTSSLPLTFTGSRPIGLKGALLGIGVGG